MFKKIFSCMLISVFLTCSSTTLTSAAVSSSISQKSSSITLQVKDKLISSTNAKPYINSKSKVMVPLLPILKEFDENAIVDLENGYVTVKFQEDNIEFYNGSKKVNLNGSDINLSVKPVVNKEDIFVPLEFFSKILNKLVGFDSDTNTVKVLNPQKNTEVYFNTPIKFTSDKATAIKLDDYLNRLQKTDNFSGSVLVAKGDTILLNKAYNMSNIEQGIKNTSQTTFPIGSVTKQFTSMAIMQLIEKGLINEQDKLSKYIPDFPNGDDITIHHLLTHTSGIVSFDRFPESPFITMKVDDLRNINNIINLFKDKPLNFKPGTKYEYSNSGYLLLGCIVEKVSNMSYEDYLKTYIFEPLNMNNTGMSYTGNEKNPISNPYQGYLDLYPIDDKATLNGTYGAGALYSTSEDLYRWSKALDTEVLVKKETLDKMFSKYADMYENDTVYYGYGLMIYDGENGHEVFHGGNTLGFTSNISKYTDKDLTIIILSNIGYYDRDSLTNVLADISLGNEYSMPRKKKVVKVDNKILSSYTGKYSSETLGDITITNEDGHLYYQDQNNSKLEIFPESKNKFFFRVAKIELVFNTDEKGNVTDLDLHQLGFKFKVKKVE